MPGAATSRLGELAYLCALIICYLLHLDYISLYQFKNYASREVGFPARITGLCGNNGVGKTNLLDAVYYCCFGKSYFSRSDAQQVMNGARGFRLEAGFRLNGRREKFTCILRENGRKEISLNDEPYIRLADHVGRYPCVIIAPDDVEMIAGPGEERRRFMDGLLSQVDHDYLTQLMTYNRVLQQRNSLLRQAPDAVDEALLSVYDSQLLAPAGYVHQVRSRLLERLLENSLVQYQQIAGHGDDLKLEYRSQLSRQPLGDLLRQSKSRDRALQRTTAGIHRDDILLELDGQPFKSLASQGQRKSLLFAMKLAAFQLLKEVKGFSPILLLDDVFEKLDAERMNNLLKQVCCENDSQVLITDTHCERIEQHLQSIGAAFERILLKA